MGAVQCPICDDWKEKLNASLSTDSGVWVWMTAEFPGVSTQRPSNPPVRDLSTTIVVMQSCFFPQEVISAFLSYFLANHLSIT